MCIRDRCRSVSLLIASVDCFDAILASYGRQAATEVLQTVETRVRAIAQLSESIAPYGDDGFSILWDPPAESPEANEIALLIADQFNDTVETSAGPIPATVSIGVASVRTGQRRDVDARTLARWANSAVGDAQRNGRSSVAFFDQANQTRTLQSFEIERHLQTAVHTGRLQVAYQPIVHLHSGNIVGIEALARWHDEAFGTVSPDRFIAIAERSGLINGVGREILDAAVAQGSAWTRQEVMPAMMTLNVSNRQLLDPDLIPSITRTLEAHQLEPRRLCIEITESAMMDDIASSLEVLGRMKDLGLILAIDDFGTGHSSLSHLRSMPVDILKIDRSFVQSIYNRDDRVIVKAVIDLAHTLGMTTIAEGVETRMQVEVLHALNCDMAQGFYLQAPVTADQVDFGKIDFDAPSPIGPAEPAAANESLGLSSAPAAATGSFVRQ